MLGMLLPEDEQFLWVAEESLLAPLPEGGRLLCTLCRYIQSFALGIVQVVCSARGRASDPGLHQHSLHRCFIPHTTKRIIGHQHGRPIEQRHATITHLQSMFSLVDQLNYIASLCGYYLHETK